MQWLTAMDMSSTLTVSMAVFDFNTYYDFDCDTIL